MKKLPPLPTAWFATVALAAAARGRGRLLSAASTAPAGFMTVVCAGSAYGSIASRRLGAPTPPADAADGQLAALPASPNCVGTADTRPDAALRQPMPPLPLRAASSSGALDDVADRIVAAVGRAVPGTRERARRVSGGHLYVHMTATVGAFRFLDDIEFSLRRGERAVRFRSSSRVGYGDMGVNRARMERVAAEWVKND